MSLLETFRFKHATAKTCPPILKPSTRPHKDKEMLFIRVKLHVLGFSS